MATLINQKSNYAGASPADHSAAPQPQPQPNFYQPQQANSFYQPAGQNFYQPQVQSNYYQPNGQGYYQQSQPMDYQTVMNNNLTRLYQLFGVAAQTLMNAGRLTRQGVDQFFGWFKQLVISGQVSQRIQTLYGSNRMLDDNQLLSLIDNYASSFIQQCSSSRINTAQQPQMVQGLINLAPVSGYNNQQGFVPAAAPVYTPAPAAQPAWIPPSNEDSNNYDRLYGNQGLNTTATNYLNGAPIPTASATKEYTQAPQVSTVQPQTTVIQTAPVAEPANQKLPSMDSDRIDVITAVPKCKDITTEVNDNDYPEDEEGNKEDFFSLVRAFYMEYQKKTAKRRGEIAKAIATAREVVLHNEPPASDEAAIKQAVTENVNHDENTKFAYTINFREQKVLDIPYETGKACHEKIESLLVESDTVNPETINGNSMAIARDVITEFKKTSPLYQKAVAPIILKRFNDYMSVASTYVDMKTVGVKRISRIDDIDELYSLLNPGTKDAFTPWKDHQNYDEIITKALMSSVFAVYTPGGGGNYLAVESDKERAVMLANPDIGVFVNYSTIRWQDEKANMDEVNKQIDDKLKKRFVITVNKRIIYTNLNVPVKEPNKIDFNIHSLDLTDGDHTVLAMLTNDTDRYWTNCSPYIITTTDATTKKLPYVMARTLEDAVHDMQCLVKRTIS